MRTKQLAGLLSIFAVVAITGVGYAVFTSNIALNATATAGTLSIAWVGPASPGVVTSSHNVTCSAVLTPTLLTITVGGLYPGAVCSMPLGDGVIVENTGSLSAVVSSVYLPGPVTGPSLPCTPLNFPVANSGYSPHLAPGASFPWFQTVGMDPGTGNGCQGDSFSFSIAFSATSS